MIISGFQKTTLLDYPGYVAATVFTAGCNFRCPFCHNRDLVINPGGTSSYAEEEIFEFLKKRQGILDGVCITGGEATLQPDLEVFIRRVKELGFLVKLDTNGYRPEVLRHLLDENLLDYVAMDVKAARSNYQKACGADLIMDKIEESVELLKNSNIPYEFRTTVVKGIHDISEFEEIGRWLCGCKAYFLQAYVDSENVISAGYEAFAKEDMETMAEIARKYIDKVVIRGVE